MKNSRNKINHHYSIVNFDVEQLNVQLQKLFTNKRCRTGIICAPAYANVCMDQFKRKYIDRFLEF